MTPLIRTPCIFSPKQTAYFAELSRAMTPVRGTWDISVVTMDACFTIVSSTAMKEEWQSHIGQSLCTLAGRKKPASFRISNCGQQIWVISLSLPPPCPLSLLWYYNSQLTKVLCDCSIIEQWRGCRCHDDAPLSSLLNEHMTLNETEGKKWSYFKQKNSPLSYSLPLLEHLLHASES